MTRLALSLALCFLAAFILLASLGTGGTPGTATAALATLFSPAPLLALVYFVGGIGLGTLFRGFTKPLVTDGSAPFLRWSLHAGLGLATLSLYSLIAGWAGWFALATWGTAVAWAPITVGLLLPWCVASPTLTLAGPLRLLRGYLLVQLPGKPQPAFSAAGRACFVLVLPVALLLLAASNTPGYLWDSEFGGYDALSYHLQLPIEWSKAGNAAPLDHNIYSFLPGAIESAFYHLAALIGATQPQHPPVTPLQASFWPIACQYLHAFFALFAATCVAAAATLLPACNSAANRANPPVGSHQPWTHSILPLCAAAIVLCTPWTIVVGSLAYNEMPVTAFFALALAAATVQPALAKGHPGHLRRAALAALFVGVAANFKPTALAFCTPPVALAFLLTFRAQALPLRKVLLAFAIAATVGVFTLSPWLVRNIIATANPVFPFFTSFFSPPGANSTHWTSEQFQRFSAGHTFQGAFSTALRLLVLPDATDPAGIRHRGLLHPHWAAFFPALVLIPLGCLTHAILHKWRSMASTGSKGVSGPSLLAQPLITTQTHGQSHPHAPALHRTFLAAAILIQLLIWLCFTHIQSRFLLPLLVPGTLLVIASVFSGSTPHRRVGLRLMALALLVLIQLTASLAIFYSQRNNQPNALLGFTPSDRTGDSLRTGPSQALRPPLNPAQLAPDLADALSPEQTANLLLPFNARIHLIGSATPFYYTANVVYRTTWDAWPTQAANGSLAGVLPGDFLIVNFAELDRLERSATLPPHFDTSSLRSWLQASTTFIREWPGQVLLRMPIAPAPQP